MAEEKKKMIEKKTEIIIEEKASDLTFEALYASEFVPDDPALKEANLLLVPYHNYYPNIEYCFGEYSEEFLRYVKEHNDGTIKADIAISDEKYQPLEIHSLLLDIGIIIVKNAILPITLSLLSNYIYDKIKSFHEKKENVNVRVEIVSQSTDGSSKSIKYVGPASDFDTMNDAINKIMES